MFLVQDGIDGYCGLSRAAVADDEFALAAADRDHGIYRLHARVDGRIHGRPVDDAVRFAFDETMFGVFHRPLAVNGFAKRVHHATDERISDGNGKKAVETPDQHALVYLGRITEDDGAHAFLFEVEDEAIDGRRVLERFLERPVEGRVEEHHLGHHHVVETVDFRDAVAARGDGTRLFASRGGSERGDLFFDALDDAFHRSTGNVPIKLDERTFCRTVDEDASRSGAPSADQRRVDDSLSCLDSFGDRRFLCRDSFFLGCRLQRGQEPLSAHMRRADVAQDGGKEFQTAVRLQVQYQSGDDVLRPRVFPRGEPEDGFCIGAIHGCRKVFSAARMASRAISFSLSRSVFAAVSLALASESFCIDTARSSASFTMRARSAEAVSRAEASTLSAFSSAAPILERASPSAAASFFAARSASSTPLATNACRSFTIRRTGL